MLSVEEAQTKILQAVQPLETERVPLNQAGGRVLSEGMTSLIDLPGFDNSAMDGYAVRAEDTHGATNERSAKLRVIAEIAAGSDAKCEITAGMAIRIFTGSPLPAGADAVVMQEDTRREGESVAVLDGVKPFENVRFRGEDVKRGEPIAAQGTRVSAAQIGVLAACGGQDLLVYRQPKVALLSTGTELREAGASLEPGQIYESNRPMLAAAVNDCGGVAMPRPIVADTLEATVSALRGAFDEADVVITSGGVSVGEHDHVKAAFEKLGGTVEFWRVAMRPGKPFVFGRLGDKFLFGLPGNPVSAFVTFMVLVRPALLRMQGATEAGLRRVCGKAADRFTNPGDRRHFMRVTLDADGTVHSSGKQSSHMLQSLAKANALLDLGPGQTNEVGTEVAVLLW